MLPHMAFFGPIVFLAELTFARSMLLGLSVRLVGVLAVAYTLQLTGVRPNTMFVTRFFGIHKQAACNQALTTHEIWSVTLRQRNRTQAEQVCRRAPAMRLKDFLGRLVQETRI